MRIPTSAHPGSYRIDRNLFHAVDGPHNGWRPVISHKKEGQVTRVLPIDTVPIRNNRVTCPSIWIVWLLETLGGDGTLRGKGFVFRRAQVTANSIFIDGIDDEFVAEVIGANKKCDRFVRRAVLL